MCDPDSSSAISLGTPPANATEALAIVRGALRYLADLDPTALTTAEQAECLRELERSEAVRMAARSTILAAFNANCGYQDDGHGGPRSWLRWRARITAAAAGTATAWMRRLAAHPDVREAMSAGDISPSWARELCDWTDQLPESVRRDADKILLAAAAAGAELADLAGLAQEIRRRTSGPDSDGDDDGFHARSLRLDLHFRGAAKLGGDLTPRCAAALRAVLESLGKKAGPEDDRTKLQRQHDALEEACRRLIASDCTPDRAGQPTRIQLVMTLDQLLGPAGPGRADAGLAGAGVRTSGLVIPGPMATPGDLCDASIVPFVVGHVDHDLLDHQAAKLLGHSSADLMRHDAGQADGEAMRLGADFAKELVLRDAIALLSGPAGLAARLRASRLTGPAASISLPLDVGTSTDTIPAHLRRAVFLRDQHCGWPGCLEVNCQVHHFIPRSEGGPTSLENLGLGCTFHHLIAIHTWGWRLVLNADGTKTAISPDGLRVIHSHSPPHAA